MRGLYVHIPFCKAKCGYCDFPSSAGQAGEIDRYLDALASEAALYKDLRGTFKTLYIGGGTPSLLSSAQLKTLFSTLEGLSGPIGALAEATFEANPESLDAEKADLLKGAGIGRLSLGLQAAQNALLQKLGRIATVEDFISAFRALRSAGFDNINADLMCGLPDQSEADFKESLSWLLALKPEHVSLYALEVHEGTPFKAAGIQEEPEAAAAMYEAAAGILKRAGLERYEISNFSLPGKESLHNMNYWGQGEYLGLGTGAASYMGGERRTNTAITAEYAGAALAGKPVPLQYSEKLEGRAKRAEMIMLGLRRSRGIELPDDIFIEFKGEIGRLLEAGLIEKSGPVIKIREDRLYVSNAVFREFV